MRLLTLVGEHDPFRLGPVENTQLCGPLLSLCRRQSYETVHIFHSLRDQLRAEDCHKAVAAEFPAWRVHVTALRLASADDPYALLAALREATAPLRRESAECPDVNLSSGGNAGYAAWAALAHDFARPPRLLEVSLADFPDVPEVRIRVVGPGPSPSSDWVLREPVAAYGTQAAPSLDKVLRRLGIRGEAPAFRRAVETAALLAPHRVPVLIQGETGTGKGVMARLIHALSDRSDGPMVPVNCAALPEKLVESTLFGHRRGAFTGAEADHTGKFRAADGGTLFLDEVGELPLEIQPKLLRVLEEGIVEAVGSTKGEKVDVRVVAATNRNLMAEVAEGRFREDLYYRLSFAGISLPPLRQRRGDIAALATHALHRLNQSLQLPRQLSPEAIRRLEASEWPGNVRELENVVGRSALLCRHDVIRPEDLLFEHPAASAARSFLPEPRADFDLEAYLAEVRRELIQRALAQTEGNCSRAARLLGVSPQAVSKFVRGASAPAGGSGLPV